MRQGAPRGLPGGRSRRRERAARARRGAVNGREGGAVPAARRRDGDRIDRLFGENRIAARVASRET